MSTNDDNRDDELFGAFFAPLNRDAPPPDPEFRRKLHAQSLEVFAAQFAEGQTRVGGGSSVAPSPQPGATASELAASEIHARSHTKHLTRRARMIRIAWRSAAAVAAAGVLAAVWILASPGTAPAAEPTLGDILNKLAGVKTVHLNVSRDGKTSETWFSRPGKLRRNNPDGTYLIAQGSRAWLVDEQANRASSRASSFFTTDRKTDQPGLDTLALLEIGESKDLAAALGARPARQVKRDGVNCLLYQVSLKTTHGPVTLEATVDAATQLLRSLETKENRDGKIEPLAAITVLAVDQPLREELFVVGETLTEDGRIGKIVDAQGIVSLKPVLASRWTPVSDGMLVRPGDWLQTDVRGANAAAVRLVGQAEIVVGPGSLVELSSTRAVRLNDGEIRIAASEKAPVQLAGPNQQKVEVKDRSVYRVQNEKLVRLDKAPLWLKGFEGAVVNESIGSLVAKVEGRDVPLTVGYHKVSVDIRDQIARTVVEESFVNHTNSRLEGVFYFPLPQDASISGFGMWIGNELVEADVVEKQRAREIYEQILRERRDPGLLEWSGGNLFKARVFPIEPHSEKRIKITYTQVLPMRGSSYRYSYALQSEMLKQHPLRELQIDVKVYSAMPLKAVNCLSHPARLDQTANSAHVEFAAQEYTPTRDFEVAVEVDGKQSSVVMVPHRRGEDGYFMLMLTPPAGDGDWQREVLPEGEPQELLVLADTSASMSIDQRNSQAEFIAAVLTSLGPKDTFNLALCDVGCDWVFEKSVPADAKNTATARESLSRRASLGWTDLEKAFAAAIGRCGPTTRVIYVGDGIPTAGDADPAAMAKRLKRLHEGKSGTFYAVSVGSTYESGVLQAIASLGGGSMRHISGQLGPRAAALELLGEMARPPLRDLKVQFQGLRTARVYPEELPNIPAGSQQILLGRYLPAGSDQEGQVTVTGMQAGKPVKFSTRVSLKDAEQGNSFIPRLWARMHLDFLLQQGSSQAIQDEIIALSEEYHIMTPYTSLLVLESDADRERFKVKRRFLMRDGEKFFAEGRDNANYELTQQQMKRAGTWRLGLRRAVLGQLGSIGRDARIFQPLDPSGAFRKRLEISGPSGGWGGGGGFDLYVSTGSSVISRSEVEAKAEPSSLSGGMVLDELDSIVENRDLGVEERLGDDLAYKDRFDGEDAGEKLEDREDTYFAAAASARPVGESLGERRARILAPASSSFMSTVELDFRGEKLTSNFGLFDEKNGRLWSDGLAVRGGGYRREDYQYTQWLNTLFAPVPAAAKELSPLKVRWPAEARAIAENLLRKKQLAQLKDGLVVDRQVEGFDLQSARLSYRNRSAWLVSSKNWLVRTENDNQQTAVQWCDGKQRAIFQKGFMLGRTRSAAADDLANPPLDFGVYTFQSLERSYQGYQVELKRQADQQTLLILTNPNSPAYEIRILVDTDRHVVLRIEQSNAGKVTNTQKYGEFVQIAGAWWPTRHEGLDDKGRRVSLTTEKYSTAASDEFERKLQAELADAPKVQFLEDPGRKLADAKQSAALGKADFDDRVTLLMHFVRSQQWDRALEHLEAAERLAPDKGGMRWVRSALLQISRRHEELKKRMLTEAAALSNRQGPSREDLPLAEYIIGQAGGLLEANEMLGLLDALRPVFERQDEHVLGLKRWNLQRVSQLQRLGRSDDALAILKQLAGQYRLDSSLQVQYAQGLLNAGRIEDACAWLKEALAQTQWLGYNEESLRSAFADMLFNQGRYEELLGFTTQWTQRNLDGTSAYQRHLGSLIRMDRVDDADKLIARWLTEGQSPEPLAGPVAARLEAAVSQALGQGHAMYSDRIDEQWLQPLAQAAVFFARHPSHAHVADRIMNHWRFQQSDNCRQVRKAAAEMLRADIDKLTPQQVQRLVNWIMPNDPAVEKDAWKRIATGLLNRWAASEIPQDKRTLGQTLVQIYASRLDAPEYLAFLRRQLKGAPEDLRTQYAWQLFEALTAQPWSQEFEDEAIAMIENLSDADEPSQRLASAVRALHTFDDRMLQARYNAKAKALEHPEELPRTDLMARQAEHLRLAREELADRLGREMAKRSGPIVKWFDAERLYWNVLAGRDLAKAPSQCWEILGPQPQKVDLEAHPELLLDEVLRNRMLVTLSNLACRKNAETAMVQRLLKYIDQGIDLDKENLRWKLLKYQLLIALDRPKDLEQALEGWIRGDDPDNRWKLSLGYLLAEQGKLADAIKLFEAVAASDELGPAEYHALADWYMAVNRREQYQRAMIATYKMTEEWPLSNHLYQRLRPWQQTDGHAPAELDEQALLVFAALFEKSAAPQNHLGLLTEYYRARHDFRLLSGLADAVIGHTAGQAYPFLQNMGGVLSEVRDEATADSIVEHLAKVRQRAKTDIDQRALDLLEALVERRAAELMNQPGPHGDKALAALKRAFQRAWSPGEPRLMADLLGSMGSIAYKPLANEQVRQLEALHRDSARGSADRLLIAHRLANAYWVYARQDQAIDFLTDAIGEFEKACGGVLPPSANDPLATLVGYLESRRHYDRGEKVLLEQLMHPAHQQQRLWLTQRLYELYDNAVRNGGDVSLGSGSALYRAAEQKMLADLANPDQNFRYNLVNRLCSLYRAGHEKEFAGVLDDLRRFASEKVPEVLKGQTNNYDSIVGMVTSTLRDLAGPRDALAFLIERIEQEPSWFRWNNQDGWSRHGHLLGELRAAVKDLGDLDVRLLKIVLAELKRDLKSGNARNRVMYDCRNSYYWAQKEQDFRKAAEEVYAERKGSGAAVSYIAQYLFHSLGHYDRAIEILFIANKDKLLDESAQWRLVEFLHYRERYGESVALLQFLVEWRPDNMSYRVALMHAYFRTNRQAELLGLLEQTDEHFHKDGRWNEGAMAALASSCLQNQLYEQSVKYYKELIPLHQRTAARRGIGDGTLSSYYDGMAQAYGGLGKTVEAVDAACGAIVSWGPTHHNRSNAIAALLAVIRQAPKLDEFVVNLDQQAAQTGLHNPIVRKAVGQIYLEKKQYAKAVAQLSLACQLQPNDLETHKALVACYDQQKNSAGAIQQILQSLQVARREITLYADLGQRYAALEKPVESERAYTSMVEMLPSESESHSALAEILQKQDRWAEAADQWAQVARIRALEPTGLLKLAEAQLHLKRWDQAADTIKKLRARSWPSRFGDVDGQVRRLEQQVEHGRNQTDRLPS